MCTTQNSAFKYVIYLCIYKYATTWTRRQQQQPLWSSCDYMTMVTRTKTDICKLPYFYCNNKFYIYNVTFNLFPFLYHTLVGFRIAYFSIITKSNTRANSYLSFMSSSLSLLTKPFSMCFHITTVQRSSVKSQFLVALNLQDGFRKAKIFKFCYVYC